jgi:sulfide:quinone oxidoreductase
MLGRRSRDADEAATKPLEVVIAGGGVAALECTLALHRLARGRVRLTLVAPRADFAYQPMAVLEPFVRRAPRELPLARFASELDIDFVQDSVVSVDGDRGVLRTAAQQVLPYDALVIAVGARTGEPLANAVTVDIPRTHSSLRGLIEEVDGGSVRSVAFVAPSPTWPLPVYELALLLREHAGEGEIDVALTIITAETGPLAVFGDAVSAALTEILRRAGITIIVGAEVAESAGELILRPGGQGLRFDRVVALPRLRGPGIEGLPADADGFLPVTELGELVGMARVFAVGDATDFPVKYGAIAAQQADIVAAAIAAAAGARVKLPEFDGAVHGFLLLGREQSRLHFSARIEGGVAHDSRTSDTPTHAPEAKVAAQYLGPYLDGLWASGARWLTGPWTDADPAGADPP